MPRGKRWEKMRKVIWAKNITTRDESFFRFHQYSVFYIYMLAKVFFSQLSRSRLGKFLVSPDPPFRYSEFPPKRLKSISNTRACQKAVCIPRGIVTCSGNINVFSLSWIGMSHSHRYVSPTRRLSGVTSGGFWWHVDKAGPFFFFFSIDRPTSQEKNYRLLTSCKYFVLRFILPLIDKTTRVLISWLWPRVQRNDTTTSVKSLLSFKGLSNCPSVQKKLETP